MAPREEFSFSEHHRDRVSVIDRGSLHRVIGLPQLYAIGYGDVGSSLYYALGITTLYALGAAPLALALAGIVFVCTVLTYAELSSAIPETGGSCSFARHAFNDLVSFIAGWALLLDYIVTIAISAYTIGPYLGYFYPILKTTMGNVPFTLLIIGVLLGMNIVGIKESTGVSFWLCLFGNATQLLIIGIGAVTLLNLPHLVQQMHIAVPNVDWSPTWPQFWKGVGMAMVAYIGIESISQLAGETREPTKNVPRAMMLTMVVLLFFYFSIASVALSAMHPRVLSTTYLEDPIAGIAAALPIGGQWLGPWIAVLGASVLFIAANAGLIGASRLTFAMGEHFQLPHLLYRLHPRFKTPYVSLILFAILAGAIVFVGKRLIVIADLYNFGAMLAFFLAHLSLLGLRIRQPDLPRPFRAWFNVPIGRGRTIALTAVVGLLGTLAVFIDVICTKPSGRNLGCLWLGLGLISYVWYRRQQHLPAAGTVEIEKLTVPEHHDVRIKRVLVPTRGGPQSETVQFAAKIAKLHGASLTALYVIEIPQALPLDTFFPEKLAEADAALERAQAIGREYDVPVDTELLQSRHAGETIVEAAKQHGHDLVVLGAAARAVVPLGRPALGSTVEYVLRNAPCRVWLCTDGVPASRPTTPDATTPEHA